jgi:hypothetical protein
MLLRRFLTPFFLVLCAAFLIHSPAVAQESTPAPGATPSDTDQLHDLASRLLKDAAQIGCGKDSCKILVNEFFLADGKSSLYGIQLADQLSSQLSSQKTEGQILDRQYVHEFLEVAHLPENMLLDVGVARWIGGIFGADSIVFGTINWEKGNQIQLSVRLVNVLSGQSGPIAETAIQNSNADLSPLKVPQKAPPGGVHVNGEDFYRAGVDGTGSPRCLYMPNPPYSQEARSANFTGVVIVQAIVHVDGSVRDLLVLKTPGLGLTESTLQTMPYWRCQPAMFHGKPVSTFATFEVNFHPY